MRIILIMKLSNISNQSKVRAIFAVTAAFLSCTSLHAQNTNTNKIAPFPHSVDLVTLDNKTINSSSFVNYGNPVIITFWLTTCGPCKKEQNDINKKLEKWQNEMGVRVIAISTDPIEKLDVILRIVKQNNWRHEIYLDKRKRLRNKMLGNWFGVPQLFIFDKDMNIVLHNFGYKKGDIEKIEKILKQLALK